MADQDRVEKVTDVEDTDDEPSPSDSDRMQRVFHGVLGVTAGRKRKASDSAESTQPRRSSHAFFYNRGQRGKATVAAAPPAHACAPDEDASAVLERETQLMLALGLPTALVQGSAMTSDRDGSQYRPVLLGAAATTIACRFSEAVRDGSRAPEPSGATTVKGAH